MLQEMTNQIKKGNTVKRELLRGENIFKKKKTPSSNHQERGRRIQELAGFFFPLRNLIK
jgi:hypothetical protein